MKDLAYTREGTALESLRAWFNELPIVRMLSAHCLELAPGHACVRLHPPADQLNPNGAVNGGVIAAVADITAGFAVAASGPASEQSATTDLSLHFMAAARALPLTVEADLVRRGRRNAVIGVRVLGADGSLCAVATGTWALGAGSGPPV